MTSFNFFSSLFKVPSTVGLYAAYAAYSVKQDLLQSFSTFNVTTLVVCMCYPMNIMSMQLQEPANHYRLGLKLGTYCDNAPGAAVQLGRNRSVADWL